MVPRLVTARRLTCLLIVSGSNGSSGTALVEVYDLDPSADSRLVNISTRAGLCMMHQ